MRKRYSRSYTVLSFLTMFSYREQPFRFSFLLLHGFFCFFHRFSKTHLMIGLKNIHCLFRNPAPLIY